ncbi:MAG: hypothetical protein ACI9US_000273, partial [Gammaproteobacteria bacterium]
SVSKNSSKMEDAVLWYRRRALGSNSTKFTG